MKGIFGMTRRRKKRMLAAKQNEQEVAEKFIKNVLPKLTDKITENSIDKNRRFKPKIRTRSNRHRAMRVH